ncbi:hypothetical protein AWENTII_004655 [Aspergillus wentii]|nr:Pleckstrin y domain-containing G member 2 [Aspergillus wentii]
MIEAAISNGAPIAEDNIINRRGGEGIYQSCGNLKKRLAEVPNFEPHMREMEEEDRTQGITDPVASLWNCLRNGYPLLTIYNASGPDELLEVPEKVAEAKRPKAATFKFLQACLQELAFPQQDCFLITDLYGDSTTGFIKVIKMVNRVLDILEMQGQLKRPSEVQTGAPAKGTGVKLTKREHILKELLETERDYVHHLQNLQALKKELEETGALTGDASHQIFLNLNNLLDFAQRFLIRMEQHYALPEEMQNWGELFIQHEEGFAQYEPFISNQMRCDAVCLKEWDKIRAAPRPLDLQQMVAQPSTLNGFFVKPFQRLTKYPLMLTELRKQTENEDLKTDILRAIDTIQVVLDSANDAIDKEHLASAVVDLADRVDDWKTLKVDTFGELLRFGTFTVLKGDNGKESSEREVCTLSVTHVYEDFWPASVAHRAEFGLHIKLEFTKPKHSSHVVSKDSASPIAYPNPRIYAPWLRDSVKSLPESSSSSNPSLNHGPIPSSDHNGLSVLKDICPQPHDKSAASLQTRELQELTLAKEKLGDSSGKRKENSVSWHSA